jgi:hypothetical protein
MAGIAIWAVVFPPIAGGLRDSAASPYQIGGVALRFWVLSALKIGVSPIGSVVVMVPSHCDGRHAKHSKSHSDYQQCPLHDQVLPLWVMESPTGFKRKMEQEFPALVPIGYTGAERTTAAKRSYSGHRSAASVTCAASPNASSHHSRRSRALSGHANCNANPRAGNHPGNRPCAAAGPSSQERTGGRCSLLETYRLTCFV